MKEKALTTLRHLLIFIMVFTFHSFMASAKPFFHVEKTYYLKGKVKGNEMAIKMLCYDELPTRYIYYYFSNDKKDRLLEGNLKGKFWNFQPGLQQQKEEANKATLNIEETKDGPWVGTWTGSSGKPVKIVLEPMEADSIYSKFSNLPFVKELDPYEQDRLSGIHFTKTRTEKQAPDLFCDWYEEKESGISFIRLRSPNHLLQTDSVNAALESLNLSLVQKFFQFIPEKITTKVETKLVYLTHELISFRILLTNSFKAQKASQARDLFTLEVKSGQQVNLEDLIWLDQGNPKPSMEDLYKIYKYRKNVFAPKVFQLLQELYPEKMNTDSCGLNKVDSWVLPAWNLTTNGIAFAFRVVDACDVISWAVIPYEKLQPFMEEKYHLKKIK